MARNRDYVVTNIYNTISPSVVGRLDKVHPVLGKNSGKSSIRLILDELGIEATNNEVAEVLEMVKAESYVTKSGVSTDMMLKFLHDVKSK